MAESRKTRAQAADARASSFLDFLERDIHACPENLVAMMESFAARLRGLTEGVEARRDERIDGPVAI
jgi:hypothetical protein